ncbi:MAG: hypothetical protein KAI28_07495, partial [Sphingomonadales bacterium]|nr:hypothetical protein [Sphingomonadales bacterium]
MTEKSQDNAGGSQARHHLKAVPSKSVGAHGDEHRNPGVAYAADWFEDIVINRSAAERRIGNLKATRTVKKEWQAAWLIKAISCIDLTTLSGDDTRARVRRLCAKGRQPVRQDILDALGMG